MLRLLINLVYLFENTSYIPTCFFYIIKFSIWIVESQFLNMNKVLQMYIYIAKYLYFYRNLPKGILGLHRRIIELLVQTCSWRLLSALPALALREWRTVWWSSPFAIFSSLAFFSIIPSKLFPLSSSG